MRLKTFTSILLFVCLFLGCTREDLSDCFEGINVRVRFHQQVNGDNTEELPIKSVDLFIFDSNQLFVTSVEDNIGPFTTTRSYNVSLPEGDYKAIVWGNRDNSLHIFPSHFVVGETTLDEAHLLLDGTHSPALRTAGKSVVCGPQQTLYHTMESDIKVRSGVSTDVHLELKRYTKDINVSVTFYDSDNAPCTNPAHGHDITPFISGIDGKLCFENTILTLPTFLYRPTTKTAHEGGFDALFNKMRLILDGPSEIILTSAVDGKVFYRKSLMQLLRGTGHNTPEILDNTHTYDIVLKFNCDGSTYATVSIWVNGWKYVETNDEV